MVLDIRQLRFDEPGEADPAPAPEAIGPDLGDLVGAVAHAPSPAAQARSVEQLRRLIPSAEGAELLWDLVAEKDEPRRLAAAQVLGYHRQWLASRSRLRQALDLIRREQQPAVAASLVWALRQRVEVAEFLLHDEASVAREAALGLPVGRQTLSSLVQVLLPGAGSRPEVERILLAKLRSIHPSLVRYLIDLLIERGVDEDDARLVPLVAALPQVPLFETFFDARRSPDWEDRDDVARRSRAWQAVARIARQTLEHSPSFELVRQLLTRSGDDPAFARRHARFLRVAMGRADDRLSSDLVSHFERLTFGATEDKVERLAQLLVDLSGRLDGTAGAEAASLLESWKSRSADLRLKIYHMEQGASE